MKKSKFIIFYSLIGVVLLSIYFIIPDSLKFTEKDKDYHQRALELSKDIAQETWLDFNIKHIPVAYHKGNREYLVFNNDVSSRKPVLPVIAATAYKVEGEYQALVPVKVEMDRIGYAVEGIGQSFHDNLLKQFSFSSTGRIDENFYISVIIHESFHVYQFENWNKFIDYQFRAIDSDTGMGQTGEMSSQIGSESINEDKTGDLEDKLIQLTENTQIWHLYQREAAALYAAYHTNIPEIARDEIGRFLLIREERYQLMKSIYSKDFSKVMGYENFYQLIEGTATYMMYHTFLALGDEELQKTFVERLENLEKDKNRYYTLGMGISLVLDKWGESTWQQNVDEYHSIDDLIRGEIALK